jgi:predicted protein tyrosine phosphatase
MMMGIKLHIAVSDLRGALRNAPNGFFTHVISTIDPRADLSILERAHQAGNIKHFAIRFDDEEDDGAPTNKLVPKFAHIEQILAFSQQLTENDHILVHCVGGISRSTATAIGIHCQHGATPEEAVAQIEKVRPQLFPNLTITKHFDAALGLNGRLLGAVKDWRDHAVSKAILLGFDK